MDATRVSQEQVSATPEEEIDGAPIWHIINREDFKTLGVSTTLCGRIMFNEPDVGLAGRSPSTFRPRRPCPMCWSVYDQVR